MKFEVSIQDFGCGISPEKLDGLFINFNNLEEHRKANPTGRGLGLGICKMIVEQMGGTVDVKSQVGYGSTFSITFKAMCKIPEAQSLLSVPELILQAPAKKKVSSSLEQSNRRVLIVNDEPFLLLAHENTLEKFF